MKYVRFTGAAPTDVNYSTYYEEYMAFKDYVEEWQIEHHSINYAIECAERFMGKRNKREMNKADFMQECINLGSWEYISEEEFIASLEEQD